MTSSTTIESDDDHKIFTSGEEDELDFQSDTAWDSLPTRATTSSYSGAKGPGIGTIFDESPPSNAVEEKLRTLEDLMVTGSFQDHLSEKHGHTEDEENDYFSTPIAHKYQDEGEDFGTPVRRKKTPLRDHDSIGQSSIDDDLFLDAHDEIPEQLSVVSKEPSDSLLEDDWELDDDLSTNDLTKDSPLYALRHAGRRIFSAHFADHPSEQEEDFDMGVSLPSSSRNVSGSKSSLFDWSEPQHAQSDVSRGAYRPRTAHSKQGWDPRSGRALGRQKASALHLRSQSVPVIREPAESGDNQINPKFGTWGLGNKGVSEDWNDDFDFDEASEENIETKSTFGERVSLGGGMKVPQEILDRQASVHGQFGQVQELTLLVQELKRLQTQADALGLMGGPSAELWKEAEGIINLATLDDEDKEFMPPQSPSSDFDAFEDSPAGNRPRKQSILSAYRESFGSDKDTGSRKSSPATAKVTSPMTPPQNRPRTSSVAQARSVLEVIHQQRSTSHTPRSNTSTPQQLRKLPFDTQSLRDLVVRAGVVTRALKEIVRKAQDLPESPIPELEDHPSPAFSKIFESPSLRKSLPQGRSTNSYLRSSLNGNDDGAMNGHMKPMTVI